jgi:hypothetical protein
MLEIRGTAARLRHRIVAPMAAAALKYVVWENVQRRGMQDGSGDAKVYDRRTLHRADGQGVTGGQQ